MNPNQNIQNYDLDELREQQIDYNALKVSDMNARPPEMTSYLSSQGSPKGDKVNPKTLKNASSINYCIQMTSNVPTKEATNSSDYGKFVPKNLLGQGTGTKYDLQIAGGSAVRPQFEKS